MRSLPLLIVALALAGCGGTAPTPAPSATASGYVAKVKALSEKQRAGVLLRAIRDADRPCQAVVEAKAVPADTGAAWLATCDDQGHWLVAIGDDGNATVTDARALAGQRGAAPR